MPWILIGPDKNVYWLDRGTPGNLSGYHGFIQWGHLECPPSNPAHSPRSFISRRAGAFSGNRGGGINKTAVSNLSRPSASTYLPLLRTEVIASRVVRTDPTT